MVLKGIVKYIYSETRAGTGRERWKLNRKRAQKCRTGKEPLVEAVKGDL